MHPAQLFLALIEGVGLILSPCILPVLPIVLAASLDGGKRRPLGIICGFVLAFGIFAAFSRQIILWTEIDPESLRRASLLLLIFLGGVMLWPALSDKLAEKMEGVARLGARLSAGFSSDAGFGGGLAIGALVGLVWTPCAGPLMAAAVIQIVQAKTDAEAVLTVFMFATGAALPMLALALFGRKIMERLSFLKKHAAALRQALGAVIIAMAVLIWTGADVTLLASGAPSTVDKTDQGLQGGLIAPFPAPEFSGIESWINAEPLTMQSLKGKVVLVDFWTYSCINCLRTLPYVTAWHNKYHDRGFTVVGVHTPEFAFEKKRDNVARAVEKHGILYPVALDNNFSTWSAFNNRYWPAHYLIDRQGRVVYTHFGEGNYDVTENNIRALLEIGGEGGKKAAEEPVLRRPQSPETYLGYERTEKFSSPGDIVRDAARRYSFPGMIMMSAWALQGEWRFDAESVTSLSEDAALEYNFVAGKVFLVMGTADGNPVRVRLFLDGQPMTQGAGKDAPGGVVTVDHETLYELVSLPSPDLRLLELRPERPGLVAYAFTFGQ